MTEKLISLLEVAKRARSGPKREAKDYDMGIFHKTQELTEIHGLKTPGKEEFWEVDNAYADSVFQAGVDLLAELGVLCVTTNRVINFTEEEVKRAAREIPSRIVVGEGADTRTIQRREIADRSIPPSFIVAGHSAWSDEAPVPIDLAVRESVKSDRVCAIQGFMYAKTDGHEITGPTHWAYGARRAFERVRSGCTLAGRPGLCVIQYPTITRGFGVIAAMDPAKCMRPSDGTLFSIQPDLHVDEDYIASSYVLEEYGLAYKENQGGGSNFIADIYGGMITSIASRLAAWMCYRDLIQGGGRASTPRGAKRDWGGGAPAPQLSADRTGDGAYSLWLNYAAFKALHRNTGLITKANIWGCHEMAVEQKSLEYLLMQAISAMRETLWGNHLHFAGSINPPSVIRWTADVSDAVIRMGLKLKDYQEISEKIQSEKLRGWVNRDPRWATLVDQRMKAYSDPTRLLDVQLKVYDFHKERYSKEYLENEKSARRYLKKLGIDMVD